MNLWEAVSTEFANEAVKLNLFKNRFLKLAVRILAAEKEIANLNDITTAKAEVISLVLDTKYKQILFII